MHVVPVRRHRALVGLALWLATLAAILGASAAWVDHDLLSAARWTRTSRRLIDRRPVRRAVSGFVVSRAFGAAGIDAALAHVLPAVAAGAVESRLHGAAGAAAGSVLSSPGGRRAWGDANRQAVSGLVRAVDRRGPPRGVSLQLTPLLGDIVQGIAADPVVRAIPGASAVISLHAPDAGRLRLLSAAQVSSIAPGVRAVRVLSWALPLAALALLLAALLLARGWRAVALTRAGSALLVAGGVLLGARALAQYALADTLVGSATDRAAVRVAWLTATLGLRTEAIFLLVAGAIVGLGSCLVRLILR